MQKLFRSAEDLRALSQGVLGGSVVQKWGERLEGGWKSQGRSQGTEERAVDEDSYRGEDWGPRVWRREVGK